MLALRKFLPRIVFGLALFAVVTTAMADQDKVLQVKSATKAPIKGQQHLVMLAVTPKGRTLKLVVANTDPAGPFAPVADELQLIQSLKPGDLVQTSWDTADNVNTISAIARYTPKPGELTPNGYIFVKAEPKDASNPNSPVIVTLNKLGDLTTATEPTTKDTNGQVQPDPLISATLATLKSGDSVWAELSTDASPTIRVIMPYAELATAKLTKFITVDVNGDKAPALQLTAGSTPIEAAIPGKDVAGKWVVDSHLMSAAHRCKVGEQVLYRIQQDGTTTWLREISLVPNQQPVAARQGQSPQNNGPTDANGIPRGRTVGGANAVPGVGGLGGF